MKLLFKFFIAIGLITSINAREIVLISSSRKIEETKRIIKILTENFSFPISTIKVREESVCDKKTNAVIHFCINQNGEIKIVEMDNYIIKGQMSDFAKLRGELL